MPRPGDFVVAKNSGQEAVFKQYRERGVDEAGHTLFELVPLNTFYPVLRSDVQHLNIVGTMIEHRKYRRR
jgi:SOS-response transcriptional repressor LexA